MSRSNLSSETLKLIQKQGLSISIVGEDDSKTIPLETGSKEAKSKQNAVALENLPNISRSLTENKPTVSQARHISNVSADTRSSNISSSLSLSPAGQSGTLTKSNSPDSTTPDIKPQNSQRVNNASNVDSKNQYPIRIGQMEKSLNNGVRLTQNSSLSEKLSNRNIQNICHSEVKLPNRNISESKNQAVFSWSQNQLPENKTNSNQNKLSTTSPPVEVKIPVKQARLYQTNLTPSMDKSLNVQRKQLHVSELKTPINQCKITVKQNDINSTIVAKGQQNMKYLSRPRIISQPNSVQTSLNSDCKQAANKSSSNALSERSLNNPFRLASTLTKKNLEEKAIKAKSAQNVGVLENQPAQAKVTQHLLKTDNKGVNQVIKISEISSELHQKPLSSDNLSDLPSPPLNTMPVNKGAVKRIAVRASTPISKKRCVKITSPVTSEQSGSQSDINTLSSDESPVKEKKVFNLKTLTPGLTITPINSSTATASTSVPSKTVAEPSQNMIVICPHCKQCSFNLTSCDNCHKKFTPTPVRYQFKNTQADSASIVVTQNVTTSIEKSMQIVYHLPGGPGQNQSFQFQRAKQLIKVSPRRGRPKRHFAEPVCYTLSSDDEEAIPYGYQLEAEGRNSDHSGASDPIQDENTDFDEPQYPGVTSINTQLQLNSSIEEEEEEIEEEEEELERDMESEEELMDEEEFEENPDFEGAEEEIDEEEEEEIPPDEENIMLYNKMQTAIQGTSIVVTCRSIRIGSFKIHPDQQNPNISVTFTPKSISFLAPLVTDGNTCVQLTLKASDTTKMMIHFGKCLPIIFAYTSKNFGDFVRKTLNMTKVNAHLFDPTSEDVKKDKITFLIDSLSDEQRAYLRQIYPGPEKLREIDQKEANEILVRSTPQSANLFQQHFVKVESSDSNLSTATMSISGVIPANLAAPHSLSITKVIVKPAPPVPVTKILTYPPPPQTGGIAINTADLATLEEGEFLNDAILDFYLKYVFYEKLSSRDREKTHIFSSFFYPRLTQKPDRPRPGDDVPKTMQMRRHNQVRTWTKHIDIFSKDYIVIPVNQHNHWFLAFVCYPGRVPNAPIEEVEPKENVSSSDNLETSKIIIKEEMSNNEDMSLQDDSSIHSNSMYEVEEPPDSDEEEDLSESPDRSTQTNNNVIYYDTTNQRKETPCILIFDSLSGPNRWRIASTLREYLEMEWKIRKGTRKVFDKNTMQGFIVKCPQQTNFSDCGLYVLQYVESFFENPIPYFGNPMPDLTNWFSDEKISKKRQQLKDLILNLQKKFMTKQTNTSIKKINLSSISPAISVSTVNVDNR